VGRLERGSLLAVEDELGQEYGVLADQVLGGLDEQAGGDVWEDRISVPGFEASRDPASRARFRRSFALEPGEYRVELSVEDQNGGRVSRARGTLSVPVFAAGGLGLGDLEFSLCG